MRLHLVSEDSAVLHASLYDDVFLYSMHRELVAVAMLTLVFKRGAFAPALWTCFLDLHSCEAHVLDPYSVALPFALRTLHGGTSLRARASAVRTHFLSLELQGIRVAILEILQCGTLSGLDVRTSFGSTLLLHEAERGLYTLSTSLSLIFLLILYSFHAFYFEQLRQLFIF